MPLASGRTRSSYRPRPRCSLLSGLATASWVCYLRARKIGDASKMAPVDKLSVLLVTVFAVIYLGERPSLGEWIGILMVGAGVFVQAFKK